MVHRFAMPVLLGGIAVGCSEPPPPVRAPPRVPIPDAVLKAGPVKLLPGVEEVDIHIHRREEKDRLEEIEINGEYVVSGSFDAPKTVEFPGTVICEIVKEIGDDEVVVFWSAAIRPRYSNEAKRWTFSADCLANMRQPGEYLLSVRKTPFDLYPETKIRVISVGQATP